MVKIAKSRIFYEIAFYDERKMAYLAAKFFGDGIKDNQHLLLLQSRRTYSQISFRSSTYTGLRGLA